MNYWLELLVVMLLFITSITLGGCAEKTVYVDRVVKVNVPVPCKTKEVRKATKGKNDAETLADELRERDELRAANEGCR